MTLRPYQIYIGLFLTVYVACLFGYWRSNSAQWTTAVQSLLSTSSAATTRHAPDSPSDHTAQTAARIQSTAAASASSIEQAGPATPLSATHDLPEETRAEVIMLSEQATSAAVPSERGKAIMKLRNAAHTDESIRALVTVLGADQSGQNRMFAVASLLSMARHGDEDGAIKAALQRATADQDSRVATRARQALESLSGAQVAAE